MGRTPSTGMPWFRHVSNASRKSRTLRLMTEQFGLAGRGFHWTMLEEIYSRAPEPFILDDLTANELARSMKLTRSGFHKMLEAWIKLGGIMRLSLTDGDQLTSDNIEAEIDGVFKDRRRHGGGKTTEESRNNPGEMPEQSGNKGVDKRIKKESRNNPGEIEEESTHPNPPAGLAGAAYSAYQCIVENHISLRNGDRIEAQKACQEYPEDWIRAAVGEACKSNRLNWPYVAAILKRWDKEDKRGE